MKPDEIDFVADLAKIGAGLQVDREKVYLLESRLAPVARREGFGSIREMLLSARQRREEKLIWAVIEALTPMEGAFFREPWLFARLKEEILPQLALRRPEGRPIRLWSAACGQGQEAYSLALTVEDAGAGVMACGVEILGTDLSERALEKAHAGLYSQFEVQRGLPIRQLLRHFEQREEMWTLSPRVRSMVVWKRVNLNTELKALGRFDVVLCRGILTQMEPDARARTLERLAGALAPGGWLALGADEDAGELPAALEAGEDGLHRLKADVRAAA